MAREGRTWRAGARCGRSHLAPGMASSEPRAGLYPQPPSLAESGIDDDAEAFWIVKRGIKMNDACVGPHPHRRADLGADRVREPCRRRRRRSTTSLRDFQRRRSQTRAESASVVLAVCIKMRNSRTASNLEKKRDNEAQVAACQFPATPVDGDRTTLPVRLGSQPAPSESTSPAATRRHALHVTGLPCRLT